MARFALLFCNHVRGQRCQRGDVSALIDLHVAAELERFTVDCSVAEHRPTHAVVDQLGALVVGVGAVLSECGNAGEHESRLQGDQILIPQSPCCEHPRFERLHNDSGCGDELPQALAVTLPLEIEYHGLLACVVVQIHRGAIDSLLVPDERRHPARLVTLRRFDLDDLGPVVRKHLRRVGARDSTPQFDDANAFK